MATADDWIARLRLEKHPEGGWFRETYRAAETLTGVGLPTRFTVTHPVSTAIYFLLRRDEFSALHRLRADEVWHFYAGSPLTLHLVAPDGALSEIELGCTAPAGSGPTFDWAGAPYQAVVPAGHWFGATLEGVPADGFALVGCTVAPGFIFEDFELGDRADLIAHFPQHRALIERLTR